MSLFDRVKDQFVGSRLEEEAYYQAALQEIESGGRRSGIWAKALSRSKGNQDAAKALYLRLLVSKLKDEAHISKRMHEQKVRELAAEEDKRRREEELNRLRKAEQERETLRRAQAQNPEESASFLQPIVWAILIIGLVLFISFYQNQEARTGNASDNNEIDTTYADDDFSRSSDAIDTPSEYNQIVSHLETRYPSLNPDSYLYDQQLVDRIVEASNRYQQRGYERSEALLIAVEDILGEPRE